MQTGDDTDDDKEHAEYQAFLSERKALTEAEQAQSLLFDRTAITISAGALGLSIAFIHEILGGHKPLAPLILLASWAFLIGAILSTLISFQFSVLAYQKQRDLLDENCLSKKPTGTRKNYWARAVGIANIASLIFIIFGLLFLAYFASENIWRGDMENLTNHRVTVTTQMLTGGKGSSPPPPVPRKPPPQRGSKPAAPPPPPPPKKGK